MLCGSSGGASTGHHRHRRQQHGVESTASASQGRRMTPITIFLYLTFLLLLNYLTSVSTSSVSKPAAAEVSRKQPAGAVRRQDDDVLLEDDDGWSRWGPPLSQRMDEDDDDEPIVLPPPPPPPPTPSSSSPSTSKNGKHNQAPPNTDPTATQDSLIIETTKGRIRGQTMQAATGKSVDAWLGIPYAQPPIGEYRFRHPRPIDRWSGIKDAMTLPPSCHQINDDTYPGFPGSEMWNPNTNKSEDCLYLSIWTPKPRPKNSPVMVWIYGGGFYSGTSTLEVYDPRILVAEENMIVAAIQYRVASLGFLYFDAPDAPGNAGLFDQRMALEWIHDNIAAFGGNPDNITLFGESAGAVSISLHLLSPLSRRLYSQAILQSGAATAPWVILTKEEAFRRGMLLAEAVGCPHTMDESEEMVKCLRTRDPKDLVNNEWFVDGVVDFPFVPVIDGTFLDQMPSKYLESKDFKKTNLLLGSNSEEGNFWLLYFLPWKFQTEFGSKDSHKRPPANFRFNMSDFRRTLNDMFRGYNKIVKEAIAYEYLDWLNPRDPLKLIDSLDKMVGDFHFTCAVNELAYRYAEAQTNPVYMYYFKQRSSVSPWPPWMGVLHGDEIAFVFGEPLNPSKGYRREDIQLSRRMMRYWANFARTGSPNQATTEGNWTKIYWPVHTPQGREYLLLHHPAGSRLSPRSEDNTGRGPRVKQCAFWKQFLPQLYAATANSTTNSSSNISQCRRWSTNGGTNLVTLMGPMNVAMAYLLVIASYWVAVS